MFSVSVQQTSSTEFVTGVQLLDSVDEYPVFMEASPL